MATSLTEIRTALAAKLALIGGTSYTLDLRGTDAVKVGLYQRPWITPCACLYLLREAAETGPLLTSHTRSPSFGATIWTSTTGSDPAAKETAIEAAYEDVRRRFRTSSDRSLGGLAVDVEISLEDIIGPETGESAPSIKVLFTVQYRETSS